MRLFILGATGRTGQELVRQGLDRGHRVTAYVRSPDKLPRRDGLEAVQGDPRDVAGLRGALAGHDAVLSALGPPGTEGFRPSTLLTDCAASTVEAMSGSGVSRLGVVSAAMLFPRKTPMFALFRGLLRHHVRDLRAMEAQVQQSRLDWTLARPPRLIVHPRQEYRATPDDLPAWSFSVSFAAVACCLLDAVERRQWVRQVVGVSQ